LLRDHTVQALSAIYAFIHKRNEPCLFCLPNRNWDEKLSWLNVNASLPGDVDETTAAAAALDDDERRRRTTTISTAINTTMTNNAITPAMNGIRDKLSRPVISASLSSVQNK